MIRENRVNIVAEISITNKTVGQFVFGQQLLNFIFVEFDIEGTKTGSEL